MKKVKDYWKDMEKALLLRNIGGRVLNKTLKEIIEEYVKLTFKKNRKVFL